MIPGKIIRISDKVTFKLWPRLEGSVLKTTPSHSIQLKPMTVSPSYPNLHPGELVPAIQQVVITIRPLPKATDKDDEEDTKEDHDEEAEDHQEHYTASDSLEEHCEEWEVSSLSTDSEVSAPNPSDPADRDDDGQEPPSPSTPSTIRPLNSPVRGRQRSCEYLHPSGKLKRPRDDSTAEVGWKSKKKRED